MRLSALGRFRKADGSVYKGLVVALAKFGSRSGFKMQLRILK